MLIYDEVKHLRRVTEAVRYNIEYRDTPATLDELHCEIDDKIYIGNPSKIVTRNDVKVAVMRLIDSQEAVLTPDNRIEGIPENIEWRRQQSNCK